MSNTEYSRYLLINRVLWYNLLTTARLPEPHGLKEHQQTDTHKTNVIKVCGQFSIDRKKKSTQKKSINWKCFPCPLLRFVVLFLDAVVIVQHAGFTLMNEHTHSSLPFNWHCCRATATSASFWLMLLISFSFFARVCVPAHMYLYLAPKFKCCVTPSPSFALILLLLSLCLARCLVL